MDKLNEATCSSHCRIRQKRNKSKHAILFGSRGIPENTDLTYYVDGQPMLSGVKKGSHILCSHCNKEVSFCMFENHAGYGSRRNPYLHIRLTHEGPNGQSLSEIAQKLHQDGIPSEQNDDVSEEHGILIYCERCKSSFRQGYHHECLGLPNFPEGIWHLSNSKQESGIEVLTGRTRRKSHNKYEEKPSKHCKRVKKEIKQLESSCVICRASDFRTKGFGDRTAMLCDQCEKEFHVGCLRENGMADLKELPEGLWFCSNVCEEIYLKLKELVEQGLQDLPPPILAMKKLFNQDGEQGSSVNIQWQLINGKIEGPNKNELCEKAAAIFSECFDDIEDPDTGEDLITAMIYGKEINKIYSKQDFRGMYCGILIVDSEVVSVALFRIFGQEVAELPLVATCPNSQKQGHFQTLFECIEWLLCSLRVKTLILPATAQAEPLWANKFGFTRTSKKELHSFQSDIPIVCFEDNSILGKQLLARIEG